MKTLTCLVILGATLCAAPVQADSFRFGIMNDTQGAGPSSTNGVSVRLMGPVVARMVNEHSIDILIHVGDLTEDGSPVEFDQWLTTAGPLYDANIKIYPIRGNHDVRSEIEITAYDPLFGEVTIEDTAIWDSKFPHLDPASPSYSVERGPGASYAFTYKNTRFVALDMYGTIPTQVITWLTSQQKGTAEHFFIYTHEPLFGRSREGVVGDNPLRLQLFLAMANNGAEAYFSGHDHQYSRSAAVFEGNYLMQHYVLGSNSEKYYRFENGINVGEEVGFKQINDQVNYSIVTIDGAFVTIEQYMSDHPDASYPDQVWTPNWYLADRITYSTNGNIYAVEAGGSFAGLSSDAPASPGFIGTSAQILAGNNDTFETLLTSPDPGEIPEEVVYGNQVNFGWRVKDALKSHDDDDDDDDDIVVSDIMSLDGMADAPNSQTDVFVLAMSYDDSVIKKKDETKLRLGCYLNREWEEAVEANVGDDEHFVEGAWDESYGLGMHGVDIETDTVWAVLNHNCDFAVITDD